LFAPCLLPPTLVPFITWHKTISEVDKLAFGKNLRHARDTPAVFRQISLVFVAMSVIVPVNTIDKEVSLKRPFSERNSMSLSHLLDASVLLMALFAAGCGRPSGEASRATPSGLPTAEGMVGKSTTSPAEDDAWR
jgi:hypothetical protein